LRVALARHEQQRAFRLLQERRRRVAEEQLVARRVFKLAERAAPALSRKARPTAGSVVGSLKIAIANYLQQDYGRNVAVRPLKP
jgi:hypothetical protein